MCRGKDAGHPSNHAKDIFIFYFLFQISSGGGGVVVVVVGENTIKGPREGDKTE